jgi:outer membrane protein assembly factor BamB
MGPDDRPIESRTLYVGSQDFALYAIDADSGHLRWKYETGNPITTEATPVADTVYVKVDGKGLLALNTRPIHEGDRFADPIKRSGHLRWMLPNGERFLVRGEKYDFVLGPTENGALLDIYAMDEKSGKEFGRYTVSRFNLELIPSNTMDDFFYAVHGSGYIFALKDSKKPWE